MKLILSTVFAVFLVLILFSAGCKKISNQQNSTKPEQADLRIKFIRFTIMSTKKIWEQFPVLSGKLMCHLPNMY